MDAKDFIDDALRELQRAVHDRKHPFRYFSLGTSAGDQVNQRMVVLRGFGSSRIKIFTDKRTPKVSQLNANSACSGLFWHPRQQLQLRAQMVANLSDERLTASQVGRLSDCNTVTVPGSHKTGPIEINETMTTENVQVIHLQIISVDVLKLDRQEHLRAQAALEEGVIKQSCWVIP